LAHFCWGLLIVTAEKGKAIEIAYSAACSLVTFSGVSYCDNKKRLTMIQKIKSIKTLGNPIYNRKKEAHDAINIQTLQQRVD
jgi:hypothetical protein